MTTWGVKPEDDDLRVRPEGDDLVDDQNTRMIQRKTFRDANHNRPKTDR